MDGAYGITIARRSFLWFAFTTAGGSKDAESLSVIAESGPKPGFSRFSMRLDESRGQSDRTFRKQTDAEPQRAMPQPGDSELIQESALECQAASQAEQKATVDENELHPYGIVPADGEFDSDDPGTPAQPWLRRVSR